MPSTVYKGDLAEVTFASETGLRLTDDNSAIIITTVNSSLLQITGNTTGSPLVSHFLQYPRGMLIGSKLVFFQAASSSLIENDDVDGRVFTITDFRPGGTGGSAELGNDNHTQITISPAMKTGAVSFATGDGFEILPFCTPPFDTASAYSKTGALTSDESCKIDQFLGIASAITLPETKVDLKRFHVVGLGRDVSVQVPGKFVTEGGSFEVNMHTARWLKYCLGKEAVETPPAIVSAFVELDLAAAEAAGVSQVTLNAVTNIAVDDYIAIVDATTTSCVSDHEPSGATWDGAAFSGLFDNCETNEYRRVIGLNGNIVYLDEPLAYPHDPSTSSVRVIWQTPKATGSGTGVKTTGVVTVGTAAAYGSITTDTTQITTKVRIGDVLYNGGPDSGGGGAGTLPLAIANRLGVVSAIGSHAFTIANGLESSIADNDVLWVATAPYLQTVAPSTGAAASSTGNLHYAGYAGVQHLLYSKDTLPSFCLEVSQRRRDVNEGDTSVADGTSADSKELTRVYRGCKVKDWTLSTDNDAALKLAVNFDSALCYTDTGRLEPTANIRGSRYRSHQMFDDTANTEIGRYVSGIGKGTQKPYMFYNGSITLAGQTIGQVVSFTLTGATGLTTHYAINGADTTATAVTDQVPFAGSRNPALLVEGQTEYSMDLEIIVDDPIFFHKMRTATEFTNSATNQILLEFTKNGDGTNREKMSIIIDDYYITEAPVQIPEDKGAVKSALKVMPKAVKIVCRDTILKY